MYGEEKSLLHSAIIENFADYRDFSFDSRNRLVEILVNFWGPFQCREVR
jgi:hypothetical protein